MLFSALGILLTHRSRAPVAFGVLWFGSVFAGVVTTLWIVAPARRVWLVEGTLQVRARGRRVRLPLDAVERVSSQAWTSPERVVLHLLRPGELGSRVVFLPHVRLGNPFRPHPVVAELRELLARDAGTSEGGHDSRTS